MLYAFDIGEARMLCGELAKAQPHPGMMAYWAMAEAETFDINVPTTAAGERRGALAIAPAQSYSGQADATERELIAALARRYAPGSIDVKIDMRAPCER